MRFIVFFLAIVGCALLLMVFGPAVLAAPGPPLPTSDTSFSSGVKSATPQTTTLTANGTACTTPGGASCTIIMDAVDVSRFANVTVWFYVSGAATVNDILLEASPDNGTTFWKEINASQCDNTATLDACILNNIGHFTWLRAEARASANSATKVFISGFRP